MIFARSSYFRQIEEDVEKHSASILKMISSLNSFKTKDMKELSRFHQNIEQVLEKLTDETQVELHAIIHYSLLSVSSMSMKMFSIFSFKILFFY